MSETVRETLTYNKQAAAVAKHLVMQMIPFTLTIGGVIVRGSPAGPGYTFEVIERHYTILRWAIDETRDE